eukprot:g78657.t1
MTSPELLRGDNVQHKSGQGSLFLDLDPDAFAFILSYFREKSKTALIDIVHQYYLAQYSLGNPAQYSFGGTESQRLGTGSRDVEPLTFCRACVIPLNYDKEFTNVYIETKGAAVDASKNERGDITRYPLRCISCETIVGAILAGFSYTNISNYEYDGLYGEGYWKANGTSMSPGPVMTLSVRDNFRETLTTAQKRLASSGVHQLRYLQVKGFEYLNFDKWRLPRKPGQNYPLMPGSSRFGRPLENETRQMMYFASTDSYCQCPILFS